MVRCSSDFNHVNMCALLDFLRRATLKTTTCTVIAAQNDELNNIDRG